MIKYVASDLDGTLLRNGAQSLDAEVFDLIRRLKEKGIHFIAASGRQYDNLYRLFEPVQDEILMSPRTALSASMITKLSQEDSSTGILESVS